jgi:hypothetical protein
MTEPALPLLREFQAQWSGSIYQQRPATERWAAAYTWHITGWKAARFLVAIRPYLRLKANQADCALRVFAIREGLQQRSNGQAKWTPEAREACEAIKQQMHVMNAKGPRAPALSVEVA